MSGVIHLDGREHPPETVWEAQELYCVARLTYDQVADQLGVAASTLKRWGKQYDWRDKRANLAQAQADMRADLILARSGMIKELLDSKDPVVGFAVAKLEALALDQAKAEREGQALKAKAKTKPRKIETKTEAVDALKEAIGIKLNRLLTSPEDVDLKAVRDLKEALALIGTLDDGKGKDKGGGGLSAEDAQMIQNEILGV